MLGCSSSIQEWVTRIFCVAVRRGPADIEEVGEDGVIAGGVDEASLVARVRERFLASGEARPHRHDIRARRHGNARRFGVRDAAGRDDRDRYAGAHLGEELEERLAALDVPARFDTLDDQRVRTRAHRVSCLRCGRDLHEHLRGTSTRPRDQLSVQAPREGDPRDVLLESGFEALRLIERQDHRERTPQHHTDDRTRRLADTRGRTFRRGWT